MAFPFNPMLLGFPLSSNVPQLCLNVTLYLASLNSRETLHVAGLRRPPRHLTMLVPPGDLCITICMRARCNMSALVRHICKHRRLHISV